MKQVASVLATDYGSNEFAYYLAKMEQVLTLLTLKDFMVIPTQDTQNT